MNNKKKVAVILIVLLVVFFLFNLSTKISESNKEAAAAAAAAAKSQEQQNNPPKSTQPSIRYFSQSDKIILQADSQTIYTKNPETKLTYYAVDGSNKPVHFRDGDRAFVRILGITRLFTENTEIFHPESNGIKDNTIFSGNISISEPGTYLVKVCLGTNINLDSEGVLTWPFGCYEDQTSLQMNVYQGGK